MINKEKSELLMSQTMDWMRFPLIVGVVFIHAFTLGADSSFSGEYKCYYYISNLFSQVIGRLAVPIFFFISGYLFFFKVDGFSTPIYLLKLKKRFKSLLIPYLFWNIIIFLFFYLIHIIPTTSNYIKGGVLDKLNMNFFCVLFGIIDGQWSMPWAYQFWFIRDLIICVVISPLIYWLITKFKVYFIITIGIAWFLDFKLFWLGMSFVSIFFFSAGALLSLHNVNLTILSREMKIIGLLYPILVLADLLTKNYTYNIYIHHTAILSGIIASFLIVSYLIEQKKVKPMPFLSAASFFVFAFHEPMLTIFEKLLLTKFSINSDIKMCIAYLFSVFITTIISISLYFILNKFIPKVTSYVTGGR